MQLKAKFAEVAQEPGINFGDKILLNYKFHSLPEK